MQKNETKKDNDSALLAAFKSGQAWSLPVGQGSVKVVGHGHANTDTDTDPETAALLAGPLALRALDLLAPESAPHWAAKGGRAKPGCILAVHREAYLAAVADLAPVAPVKPKPSKAAPGRRVAKTARGLAFLAAHKPKAAKVQGGQGGRPPVKPPVGRTLARAESLLAAKAATLADLLAPARPAPTGDKEADKAALSAWGRAKGGATLRAKALTAALTVSPRITLADPTDDGVGGHAEQSGALLADTVQGGHGTKARRVYLLAAADRALMARQAKGRRHAFRVAPKPRNPGALTLADLAQ